MCDDWLLSIPPEIRYAIYQWLDTRSKMVLRAVCKQLRDEMQPLLELVANIQNKNDVFIILDKFSLIKGARFMFCMDTKRILNSFATLLAQNSTLRILNLSST